MRIRTTAALATAVTLGACAFGARMAPGGEATHQVRYTVRCEECSVAYTSSNQQMKEAAVRGLWHTTVGISTSVTGTVMLTATPTTSAGIIYHAYIDVDGKILAESRQDSRGMFSDAVTLTARLPN